MKHILIAHQSTIPHYRVPFYNALERLRPDSWSFDVVFDPSEIEHKRFFREQLNPSDFLFSILETRTFSFVVLGKRVSYQTLWRRAGSYDLIIVENALNNLSYPICQLHQLHGVLTAHWGHGKDRAVARPSAPKRMSEQIKMFLARRANGFFAYTPGVKRYVEERGLPSERVFVINNTIDIEEQRRVFDEWHPQRESIQDRLGVRGHKVLLFVGRFTHNKRIDLLLEAFSILRAEDPRYSLFLVGSGRVPHDLASLAGVRYFGSITDLDRLAPIYIASDVLVHPGAVGLGPLQALCYGLPVITIDSLTHGPEVEYLSPANSIILDTGATAREYAMAVLGLLSDASQLEALRSSAWPSIRHLTIDRMAQRFIHGVNTLLGVTSEPQ